jgi:Fe-S cluster assembly protein SufD
MNPSAESPLFDQALQSLAHHAPVGPDWLAERQKAAGERLRREGLPHGRIEEWRFTSLRPVKALPFQAASAGPDGSAALLDDLLPRGALRVNVVNGRVELPASPAMAGVTITSLASSPEDTLALPREHLMRLSRNSTGFSAQNDSLFTDAVCIASAEGADDAPPIVVVHTLRPGETPTVAYPRVLVVAAARSHLRLVEVFVSAKSTPSLQCATSEAVVLSGAILEHTRVHIGAASSFVIGAVEVEEHEDAHYDSKVYTLGGALCRVDLRSRLVGARARCTLDGLYLANRDEHVDHHTRVEHLAPKTRSDQCYRGVIGGGGHAVFAGAVTIASGADGSEAHQKNANLLLADDATVHTLPQLEIDTDDVVCSHGATVGRLDENQVFYLQSRGIDEATARAVLVDAFAGEMVDRITDEGVRDWLKDRIRRHEPAGDLARRFE